MTPATCEQCRRRPAEVLVAVADRCRARELRLCRDCARAPAVRGPFAVRDAPPAKK